MENFRKLTPEYVASLKKKPTDFSDIPEITESQWEKGHLRSERLQTDKRYKVSNSAFQLAEPKIKYRSEKK